jgi:hypothetical protein
LTVLDYERHQVFLVFPNRLGWEYENFKPDIDCPESIANPNSKLDLPLEFYLVIQNVLQVAALFDVRASCSFFQNSWRRFNL